MSFDWSSYLALAHKLAERSDEAARRSAISRAYYAVYILARRKLEANGVELNGEQHRAVWDAYASRSNPGQNPDPCARLAKDASVLKQNRVRADYKDEYEGLEKAVQRHLELADQVLTQLDNLPAVPTRAEVQRAQERRR